MLAGRRLLLVVAGVVVSVACESPAASDPPAVDPDPRAEAKHEPAVTPGPPVGATSPGTDEETITADIVDAGPLGHGACNQRSYKVRPYDGTPELWIHFERCGEEPGRDFGALQVGNTYRFRVIRGASGNFGDEPMIVAAEPVDP